MVENVKGAMLTDQELDEMEPDTIFATGEALDAPDGLFMARTGKMLRWVAVRGGIGDWAMYAHFADHDRQYVRDHGDKVMRAEHIRKYVKYSDAAFARYRY